MKLSECKLNDVIIIDNEIGIIKEVSFDRIYTVIFQDGKRGDYQTYNPEVEYIGKGKLVTITKIVLLKDSECQNF